MRLIVWLCSNSKNPLLVTQMESWAHGVILSSSITSMELHVAADIKESKPWNYKGINCVEPLHLTLATSHFLRPSTSETTTFMMKFQRKLIICSDCNISVDAKNFCTRWATYQSTDGLNTGWICVWGCWVQNSTPSVVDHLMANGAFLLVLLDPAGCNTHVRCYSGLMKPMS